MRDISDLRILIICILIADLVGSIIYGLKGNVVGIFNCVSWAVLAGFVLMNLEKVFK